MAVYSQSEMDAKYPQSNSVLLPDKWYWGDEGELEVEPTQAELRAIELDKLRKYNQAVEEEVDARTALIKLEANAMWLSDRVERRKEYDAIGDSHHMDWEGLLAELRKFRLDEYGVKERLRISHTITLVGDCILNALEDSAEELDRLSKSYGAPVPSANSVGARWQVILKAVSDYRYDDYDDFEKARIASAIRKVGRATERRTLQIGQSRINVITRYKNTTFI